MLNNLQIYIIKTFFRCCRSRKRRPSGSQEDCPKDSTMDECSAALVLMSLSCSPHSPNLTGKFFCLIFLYIIILRKWILVFVSVTIFLECSLTLVAITCNFFLNKTSYVIHLELLPYVSHVIHNWTVVFTNQERKYVVSCWDLNFNFLLYV